MDNDKLFSSQLESWFKSKQPKTILGLTELFCEKSFAVGLLLLMFIPALPLPTGGVTHVFEIVAMLLSVEMVLGRKVIWLPKRWQKLDISGIGKRQSTRSVIRKIGWVEKHSKPRLKRLIRNSFFLRVTGLVLGVFCLAAFFAPPFSGLDTLPSLAVVLVALSMIFEDIVLYIAGLIIGVIGISTVLVLGTVLLKSFRLVFW